MVRKYFFYMVLFVAFFGALSTVSKAASCGEYCTTNADCPADNTCQANRCILTACTPSYQPVYSGPYSAAVYRLSQNPLCSSDGCRLLAQVTTVSTIPKTSLFAQQTGVLLLSLVLISSGILVYRVDILNKGWLFFKTHGGNYIISFFDKYEWMKILKKHLLAERKKFEKNF